MNEIPQCSDINRQRVNRLHLRTERLIVQKFSKRDVEHNVRHELDRQLMKYIREPWSLDKTRSRTQRLAADWSGQEGQWALAAIRLQAPAKGDDGYLGIICLRYESVACNTLEIGWRLGREYHGRGYASEAATAVLCFMWQQLHAHKVVAYCFTENRPSVRLMEKLGLRREGILREADKVEGQWHDLAIFGQLESENGL